MDAFEKAKSLADLGLEKEAISKYTECIVHCIAVLKKADSKEEAQTGPISLDRVTLRQRLALAYNNRGHLKYLSVDFNEAIADYTEALVYDRDLAIAFYNRGQIHYRMGRFECAADDLESAVALRNDFKDARAFLEQSRKNIASPAIVH